MKTSKKDFIVEAEDIINTANNGLLELQGTFNPDTLNSVFRAVHTLKGLSGLFGFQGITDLSHNLESVLDDLRLDKIKFTDNTVAFIFKNMDILKNLVTRVSEDKEIDDVSDAIKDIESFRVSAKSESRDLNLEDLGISPSILKVLSEYEGHRLKSNIKDGKGIYSIKAVFSLIDFATGLEALNSKMKESGEIMATLPNSEGVPDGSIGFNLLFGSSSKIDDIKSKAAPAVIEEIYDSKKSEPETKPSVSKAQEVSLKSTSNTIRVDIGKLDKILNTVGELVMAKGALVRIGAELAENMAYHPLTADVYKIAQTLERKLAELQDQILELRMVPFSQIFMRLSQVIKRHIREVGKKIELELYGEDTEIDKLLAEEIIDPLVHIIRNAIDHGIEQSDKRISLGKQESGRVTLKAFSKGSNVMVTAQDDGAGIDPDKILRNAIERKMISEDQVLKPKEIIDLIFIPGLSTKEVANEVSGRGMGMDIVKEKITSLGGFVDVESEIGEGTRFILTLPITLAIIKALIVDVENEQFAIPITSIMETLSVRPEKIQTIEGREVIELRGEMLSLLNVADVFLLEKKPKDEYFVVVVGVGGKRLGLLIDNLTEQTEIVVKPLGDHLKNIRGFAGAAEIGRHKIVLVLDVDAMMEEAFSKKNIISSAQEIEN
ncbi:MAG: chemotaxis protein CheA [Candidatus Mariimomonas ferrooxydans]